LNNFIKGVLVGVGIGLLVAPVSGDETRRIIRESFIEWRNSLPEDSRLNQYTQQVSERVAQTRENLQNYAQQAASKVKDTSSTLSNKAQQSVQQARQTGQEVVDRAKQSAARSSGTSSSTRVVPEPSNTLPRE
jgi:gas vesicle protein